MDLLGEAWRAQEHGPVGTLCSPRAPALAALGTATALPRVAAPHPPPCAQPGPAVLRPSVRHVPRMNDDEPPRA